MLHFCFFSRRVLAKFLFHAPCLAYQMHYSYRATREWLISGHVWGDFAIVKRPSSHPPPPLQTNLTHILSLPGENAVCTGYGRSLFVEDGWMLAKFFSFANLWPGFVIAQKKKNEADVQTEQGWSIRDLLYAKKYYILAGYSGQSRAVKIAHLVRLSGQ